MNRSKLFIDNFFIYGFGRVAAKAIPLIFLPIITRLISDTSVFGISDLLKTFASFGSAIAVMGITDAMFRIYFDKDDFGFKQDVCTNSLMIVFVNSIIILIAIVLFSKPLSQYLFKDPSLYKWMYLTGIQIVVMSLQRVLQAPTRMQNKRMIFILTNLLTPIITYSVSIPVIIYYDPLTGLIAGWMSTFIILLIIFLILNYKWFSFKHLKMNIISDLLKIGVPLMPTFLMYWIFNSYSRVVIANVLGTSYNGIYAVGARFSMISQLIYIAFSTGWSYFTFSTMKDEDHVNVISKVYEYLGLISFLFFILILPWLKILFQILFKGDYISGYIVSPYLLVAPFFLMLFQTAGTQMLVVKKSYIVTIILLFGGVFNVLTNTFMTKKFGIEGAAFITLASYVLSTFIMTIVAQRMKLLNIRFKFVIIFTITMVFATIFRLFTDYSSLTSIIMSFVTALTLILIYFSDIKFIFSSIYKGINKK